MAQLKDLIVSGPSRFVGPAYGLIQAFSANGATIGLQIGGESASTTVTISDSSPSVSITNSGTGVVTGGTTGGTKGHTITLSRSAAVKVNSASTADSATSAGKTSGTLNIYNNGTLLKSFNGSSTMSALTTDTLVKETTATTKAFLIGHAATGSTASGITHANVYMSGGALYSEAKKVLTGFTETKVTVTNSGTGVVTGGTSGGTNGHSITLNKTTAVKVDSADTTHVTEMMQSYRTTGTIRGVHSVTLPGVTALTDGMSFKIQLGVEYNGNWNSLKVNTLDAAPLWYAYGTALTSHYRKDNEITVTYRTTCSATALVPTNSNSGLTSGVSYTNGFLIDANYVDGNDYSSLRPVYARYYTDANGVNAYGLMAMDVNGKMTPLLLSGGTGTTKPVNQNAFRPDKIYYMNVSSRIAANTLITNNQVYEAGGVTVGRYWFNADAPTYVDVYLKGTLNTTNGLFTLASGVTDYYRFVPNNTNSVTLTSYFQSGFYYIRLGRTHSTANYVWLDQNNPLFYFTGTYLRQISPTAAYAHDAGNVVMTTGAAATSASITLPTTAKRTYYIYSGATASITLNATVENLGYEHYALFKNTSTTASMTITPKAGWISTDTSFSVPPGCYLELSYICIGTYLIITGSKYMSAV